MWSYLEKDSKRQGRMEEIGGGLRRRGDFQILKQFIVIFVCQSTHSSKIWNNETYGIDWVVFVDYKGMPHYVNLSTPIEEIQVQPRFRLKSLKEKPTFWLYNRNTIDNAEELVTPVNKTCNYKAKAPLIVLVHGWLNNRDSNSTQVIKNAILTHPRRNDNVIIMDWSSMQSWNYIYSANATERAAEKLRDFVQSLANLYQISGSSIHLIGHSLGAHVVGLAGGKLKRDNLIVSRVTGLDPARPFFEVPSILPGISKDAATFVDIIHTSVGILGIFEPAGHADFYPGGGKLQPALCPSSIIPGPCEHSSAYIYFQKSLTKNFEARKCHDYFMFTTGACNRNEEQFMGEPCLPTANGSYFLDINTMKTLLTDN